MVGAAVMSRASMRGKMLPGDPRHGTVNGYSNLGCRCDKCRASWASHQQTQRAKRAQRGLPASDPRHGKAVTYANWGCRCQACKQAWAEYQRARPARRAVGGAS